MNNEYKHLTGEYSKNKVQSSARDRVVLVLLFIGLVVMLTYCAQGDQIALNANLIH